MKFKEIISDLPEEKKNQFKKWHKKLLLVVGIFFVIMEVLGFVSGYVMFGMPEPTVSLDGKTYTCQDVTDGIKGIGQRMTETGTLPPAHLLEAIETLESKLKC